MDAPQCRKHGLRENLYHIHTVPNLLQLSEAEGVELGAEGVLGARGLDECAALGGEGAELGQAGHGVRNHF